MHGRLERTLSLRVWRWGAWPDVPRQMVHCMLCYYGHIFCCHSVMVPSFITSADAIGPSLNWTTS